MCQGGGAEDAFLIRRLGIWMGEEVHCIGRVVCIVAAFAFCCRWLALVCAFPMSIVRSHAVSFLDCWHFGWFSVSIFFALGGVGCCSAFSCSWVAYCLGTMVRS